MITELIQVLHTLRGVVLDGSTIGLGRPESAAGSTTLVHCAGRPTNAPRTGSYPVCTRCSKLDGTEIAGLLRFFENIDDADDDVVSDAAAAAGIDRPASYTFMLYLHHRCKQGTRRRQTSSPVPHSDELDPNTS